MNRGEYSTRQKRELLHFLKDHDLENFSLDDVILNLDRQGTQVGRTTAYRYLESLAESGSVRKYQNAQGVTQYQHVADESRCDGHFHLMCVDCGVLLHIDCELMAELSGHIRSEHGFLLDARKSVLVGLCERCAEKREERKDGTDRS